MGALVQPSAMSALLAFALAMSGCAGSSTVPGGSSTGRAAATITDATDFSDFEGSRCLPHVHDYWDGQTKILIADSTADIPLGVTGGDALIPIKAGRTVIPGTRWINASVYANGTEIEPFTFQLQYTTANNSHGVVPLSRTMGATINSAEPMNDLPHSVLSRWSFGVKYTGKGTLTAHYVIRIARGPGPLPMDPPHPDLWRNETRRVLYDKSGPVYELFGQGSKLHPGQQPAGYPGLNGTVPYGTQTMEVGFAYNSTATDGFPYTLLMSWHGADTDKSGPFSKPNTTQKSSKSELSKWTIAVEPRMVDSPYENTTRWEVLMSYDGKSGASGSGNADNAHVEGDYHLWVAITRSPPVTPIVPCST